MRTLITLLLWAGVLLAACGDVSREAVAASDLAQGDKKELAMKLVSSAENSTLDWRSQYDYIEDIGDGRGYTAGIIGFCSGTGDMIEVVRRYTDERPDNPLAGYLPALERVNGTDSHVGLDPGFVSAWREAAREVAFQQAQDHERDTVYFKPAVGLAKRDSLNALGQFAYYDAAVVHGFEGLQGIRRRALDGAKSPADGGDEVQYLDRFLDERVIEMRKEAAHEDVSRIEQAQRRFLREGNLHLNPPLRWSVYGDPYRVD